MGNICQSNPIEQIESEDNYLPFMIDKIEIYNKINTSKTNEIMRIKIKIKTDNIFNNISIK